MSHEATSGYATPAGLTANNSGPFGGPLFADFLEKELSNERSRRTNLDARAAAVITSSGTFITLGFALGALLTKGAGYTPSALVAAILAIALTAFVVSAILALLAGSLSGYKVVHAVQFDAWRDDAFWLDSEDNARWLIADANTKTLVSLRTGSSRKATELVFALWWQVAAFALLALGLLVIFLQAFK